MRTSAEKAADTRAKNKTRKAEFELVARVAVIADKIALIPTPKDSQGYSVVDKAAADAVVEALGGDREAFWMLDNEPNRIGLGLNRPNGTWHWKVRQTRNCFGELLFASFKKA